MSIDVCPACGYPTVGPDLCFYCRAEALTGDQMFEPMLSATTLRHRSGKAGMRPPGSHPVAQARLAPRQLKI